MKTVLKALIFLVPLLLSINAFADLGFADTAVEYFDGGQGTLSCPEAQGGVFPPPASRPVCVLFAAALGDDPGPTSDYVSIPMNSFLTLGFTDEEIIDGPGDDFFISEVGDSQENAEIFISATLSTDPADFTLIGIANGNTITSFDLSSINWQSPVRAIKVVSLENGGAPAAPGFDLAHIEAINFNESSLTTDIPYPTFLLLLLALIIGCSVFFVYKANARQ